MKGAREHGRKNTMSCMAAGQGFSRANHYFLGGGSGGKGSEWLCAALVGCRALGLEIRRKTSLFILEAE